MNAISSSPAPKLGRRRLQFRLRTLLVLMLVFGAVFGWLARDVQQARAQRKAAAAIEKLGGRVTWRRPYGGRIQTALVLVEVGVGKLMGEDFSVEADLVDLGETRVTDAGLVYLRGLT
jgi:hypothetical protein